MSPTAGCSVSNNQITLTNPFGTSGSYNSNSGPIAFTLTVGGTNPYSVKDAGTFSVSTSSTLSGINYAIDSASSANIFTPTPALLLASVDSVSSYEAYDSPTSYVLKVTPDKIIPAGGVVNVIFPTEI